MGTLAGRVSRQLREAGCRPLPSGTARGVKGVRVQHSGIPATVVVSVDLDLEAKAERVTEELAAFLSQRYQVDRQGTFLYVTHPPKEIHR